MTTPPTAGQLAGKVLDYLDLVRSYFRAPGDPTRGSLLAEMVKAEDALRKVCHAAVTADADLGALRQRVAELEDLAGRLADRILAAHEVLANLAEKWKVTP